MKVTNNVREQYTKICRKSSFKCNTYAEIDFKIIRAVALGEVIYIIDGKTVVGYYNLRFEVKNNKIINMYNEPNGKRVEVSEKVKDEYDRIHMKLVV